MDGWMDDDNYGNIVQQKRENEDMVTKKQTGLFTW